MNLKSLQNQLFGGMNIARGKRYRLHHQCITIPREKVDCLLLDVAVHFLDDAHTSSYYHFAGKR